MKTKPFCPTTEKLRNTLFRLLNGEVVLESIKDLMDSYQDKTILFDDLVEIFIEFCEETNPDYPGNIREELTAGRQQIINSLLEMLNNSGETNFKSI